MDLRKSVLNKQTNVLGTSFASNSNASLYESAMEDSNNTMYYSFTNDSLSSMDCSTVENDVEDNSTSSDGDKENTVVLQDSLSPDNRPSVIDRATLPKTFMGDNLSPINERSGTSQIAIVVESPGRQEEDGKEEIIAASEVKEADAISAVIQNPMNNDQHEPEALAVTIPAVNDIVMVAQLVGGANPQQISTPDSEQQILPQVKVLESPAVAQDPNANIKNPFTSGGSVDREFSPLKDDPFPGKRVTRRSILTSKIPASTQFYSPVLRKSLERKPKMVNKPTSRRTLYETTKPKPAPTTRRTVYENASKAKPPVKPKPVEDSVNTKIPKPKELSRPAPKPKPFKCTIARCSAELPNMKAFQEHQKTHKPTSTTQPTFNCKWCDKKFQLETALFIHQTDKCSQIPFNEKRKVLSQREKKDDKRRTMLFTVPVPKARKSPVRRTTRIPPPTSDRKNKSVTVITPKRSLKCHICHMIIADALSLANHILSHKFTKEDGAGKA